MTRLDPVCFLVKRREAPSFFHNDREATFYLCFFSFFVKFNFVFFTKTGKATKTLVRSLLLLRLRPHVHNRTEQGFCQI